VRPDAPACLASPGAILLVSCYELGHQPLALAHPLALLEEAGYAPAVLDLAAERLDPEAAVRARLIALSVPMHTALRLGVKAAARIRDLNPEAHLCFYGLYASLNAGTLLDRGADSIIGGEYEEPLLRLVRALDRRAEGATARGGAAAGIRTPADPVPGVRTRAHAADPWIRKIAFTTPRRDRLPPLQKYARLDDGVAVRLAGQVEASRGCLHSCRHCPIPPVYGGRFFVVPRHTVLADVRGQVAAGATHITFGDPDFLNGPGHALAIARAMHAEFPALTFDFTAKIEHLLKHRALLAELRRLGCLFVVSAVESLSDRVLAILGKGHTRADVEAVLALLRRAGIALRPSLVPFTPWAGLPDYLDLLRFFDREGLAGHVDPIQFAIRLLVPPGSLLLEHPEMRPHLGRLDPDSFTWTWTHPDPRMDRLHADVGALVERAAISGEDPWLTFETIRARAALAAGDPHAVAPLAFIAPPPRRDKGRPPRLTEPWFC
jgi:radical SAM superfamily enzyme YgiQ (UPF0313 family)